MATSGRTYTGDLTLQAPQTRPWYRTLKKRSKIWSQTRHILQGYRSIMLESGGSTLSSQSRLPLPTKYLTHRSDKHLLAGSDQAPSPISGLRERTTYSCHQELQCLSHR